MLGAADIAIRRVLPAIAASSLNEILGIASRDADRARSVAAVHGIPRSYGSYQDLLADPEVEAVYIPLPNALHAEWTIRAAEAGKHVLCEKPMALSAEECRAMVAACRRHNVLFVEGLMYRLHPQHAMVRRLIQSGAIGTPRMMDASFCVRMSRPPSDIRFAPDLGGRALFDLGVYAIDSLRFILGSEPARVSGQVQLAERRVDVDAVAALAMQDGTLATVSVSFEAAGSGTYRVLGSRGWIRVQQAYAQRPDTLPRVIWDDGDREQEASFPLVDQHVLLVDAFAATLRQGAAPPLRDDDGIANVATIQAIKEASASGRTIDLQL